MSDDVLAREGGDEPDELLGCQLCGAQLIIAGRIVCDDCRKRVEPDPEPDEATA